MHADVKTEGNSRSNWKHEGKFWTLPTDTEKRIFRCDEVSGKPVRKTSVCPADGERGLCLAGNNVPCLGQARTQESRMYVESRLSWFDHNLSIGYD